MWKRFKDTDYYLSEKGEIMHILKSGKKRKPKGWTHKCPVGSDYYVFKAGGKEHKLGRAVYELYIGKIPEGYSVYHKNGVLSDNDMTNLVALPKKDVGKMTGHLGKSKQVLNKDTGDVYRSCREASKRLYISNQTALYYVNGKVKKPMYNLEYLEEE